MVKKPHPIRAYRIAHGLSCADVGKRINSAASTIRSWENGNRDLTAEMAVQIERALGIDRAILRPDLFKREAA